MSEWLIGSPSRQMIAVVPWGLDTVLALRADGSLWFAMPGAELARIHWRRVVCTYEEAAPPEDGPRGREGI